MDIVQRHNSCNRLRVFENRVLSIIFGPKRDEMMRLEKMHNEQLHNLYSSPNIIIIRIIKSKWKR
jgi:hypothetical protein